jgi:hypothetical protein
MEIEVEVKMEMDIKMEITQIRHETRINDIQ